MAHNILEKEIAQRKIHRMAYEILEQNVEENELILCGIKDSGLIIAKKLQQCLQEIYKGTIILIEVSIDKKNPKNISFSQNLNFDKKVIILIDDVTNSGKTLLYALKPLLEYYPKKIQSLVLIERSYKEYPVTPDYVGMSVATGPAQKIIVETNAGEITGAIIG